MFTLYSFCDIITVQRRRIGKERTPYALEMKMNISKRMDKMKKNNKRINRNDISEFLMLSAGAVLTAAGVYFFKIPNGFSTGGFSGLSILLGELIAGVNTSTFVTVLNLLSLVVGFGLVGSEMCIRDRHLDLCHGAQSSFPCRRICLLRAGRGLENDVLHAALYRHRQFV